VYKNVLRGALNGKGSVKLLCEERCCSGGAWDFFSVLKSIMSGAVCCSGGY